MAQLESTSAQQVSSPALGRRKLSQVMLRHPNYAGRLEFLMPLMAAA